MPYSDDPANVPSDRVRFLVGDISTTKPDLSDAEVDFLLADENNDARRAAARAAEALAARYTQKAYIKEVGPLRIEYRQKASEYLALAKSLWSKVTSTTAVPFAGGISVTDKDARESDPDVTPPDFYREMMDYGSALDQDDLLS